MDREPIALPCEGEIGNCYLVATAASLRQLRPDVLKEMIRDHGDGTYTVTFKARPVASNRSPRAQGEQAPLSLPNGREPEVEGRL